MDPRLRALLVRHKALERTDNVFQRRARLLQAMWRDEQGLAPGELDGRKLGSRLPMPSAMDALSNYLTDTIRSVVRSEVLDRKRSKGKLYKKPRIFDDLLSSQPICFNLFGELQQDLGLASRALRRLTQGRIDRVTAVGFEYSPGRGDLKYTGDASAFDVFIVYLSPEGAKGFAAIEVKYHEDLNDKPATHKDRYDQVAAAMKCFDPKAFERLKKKPLQQIWRDHLLAGSLRLDKAHGYADSFFAFLYPKDNERCARAVEDYRACLTNETSFVPWTLEALVEAITSEGGGKWVESFASRYLAFEKIEAALGSEK